MRATISWFHQLTIRQVLEYSRYNTRINSHQTIWLQTHSWIFPIPHEHPLTSEHIIIKNLSRILIHYTLSSWVTQTYDKSQTTLPIFAGYWRCNSTTQNIPYRLSDIKSLIIGTIGDIIVTLPIAIRVSYWRYQLRPGNGAGGSLKMCQAIHVTNIKGNS